MRKKDLILQNEKLFEELDSAVAQIKELKQKLSEKEQLISSMRNETEILGANEIQESNNEENKSQEPELLSVFKYGAAVIGKTVVQSARYCTSLTSAEANEDTKELVNLILGRAEVAKAEILKIISSDATEQEKLDSIDKQFDLANDYFKSVMAQRQGEGYV